MKHNPDSLFLCNICKKEISYKNMSKNQRALLNKKGYFNCCVECGKISSSKHSSITMSKTNKKYASERMKKNNPMNRPEIRKKVSDTLKKIGHKPKIQGGNGKGLTRHQELLLNNLSSDYIAEYPIPTKIKKGNCYPSCYKIDIANPKNKIAIEVDGSSHSTISRKLQDEKKDNFLISIGWKILRIKNKDIDKNLKNCLYKIEALYD